MANTIDSNSTGLAIAEEASPKTLPGTPVWYEQEPNSYADFGAEISQVARDPINPSRQRKKGVIVDLDASGGFTMDVTQTITKRMLQGFLFADAREKASTAPLNGTAITLTAVDATNKEYEAASGLTIFKAGHIVNATGFTNPANNGLKHVASVLAGGVKVTESLVIETPPAGAAIEAVGFKAAAGDINLAVSGGVVTLTSAVLDFTTLGLNIGEQVFVGGDATAEHFVNNGPGFARIKSIADHALAFDDVSWIPVNETGTALTICLYFGTVIRNEKAANLIKRRSYQMERQLGSDGVDIQSEYLEGAIPNELTINMAQAEKITAELKFVGLGTSYRTGTEGVKAGTRVGAPIEDAYNTTSNLYRVKLSVKDDSTANPASLFAYVSDASVSVNNNVTPNKALAVLGGFDASVGTFEVSGSLTAYFADVAALSAIRENKDVQLSIIAASDNRGFSLDMPMISLGGGRLSVEKDAPVNIPLDTNVAECEAGYTLLTTFFAYLPDAAMPE